MKKKLSDFNEIFFFGKITWKKEMNNNLKMIKELNDQLNLTIK